MKMTYVSQKRSKRFLEWEVEDHHERMSLGQVFSYKSRDFKLNILTKPPSHQIGTELLNLKEMIINDHIKLLMS